MVLLEGQIDENTGTRALCSSFFFSPKSKLSNTVPISTGLLSVFIYECSEQMITMADNSDKCKDTDKLGDRQRHRDGDKGSALTSRHISTSLQIVGVEICCCCPTASRHTARFQIAVSSIIVIIIFRSRAKESKNHSA